MINTNSLFFDHLLNESCWDRMQFQSWKKIRDKLLFMWRRSPVFYKCISYFMSWTSWSIKLYSIAVSRSSIFSKCSLQPRWTLWYIVICLKICSLNLSTFSIVRSTSSRAFPADSRAFLINLEPLSLPIVSWKTQIKVKKKFQNKKKKIKSPTFYLLFLPSHLIAFYSSQLVFGILTGCLHLIPAQNSIFSVIFALKTFLIS